MEERLYSQILDELAREAVPGDTDLWPAIRQQAAVKESPNGRFTGLLATPPLRRAGLALTLVLVIALGALGALSAPGIRVDVVEFLGLDEFQALETATVPAYALTVTPVATPGLSVAVPGTAISNGTDTATPLVFEHTPLPTVTRAN